VSDKTIWIVVVVFWIVMPWSYVVGYWCFRGLCCLHLQDEWSRRLQPESS